MSADAGTRESSSVLKRRAFLIKRATLAAIGLTDINTLQVVWSKKTQAASRTGAPASQCSAWRWLQASPVKIRAGRKQRAAQRLVLSRITKLTAVTSGVWRPRFISLLRAISTVISTKPRGATRLLPLPIMSITPCVCCGTEDTNVRKNQTQTEQTCAPSSVSGLASCHVVVLGV